MGGRAARLAVRCPRLSASDEHTIAPQVAESTRALPGRARRFGSPWVLGRSDFPGLIEVSLRTPALVFRPPERWRMRALSIYLSAEYLMGPQLADYCEKIWNVDPVPVEVSKTAY